MAVAALREHPAPWRSLEQTLLDEIGLDHFFQHVALLGKRGRERFHACRAAPIIFGNHGKITAIHRVEAQTVDFQLFQGAIGSLGVNSLMPVDGGKVAHTA